MRTEAMPLSFFKPTMMLMAPQLQPSRSKEVTNV